MGSVAQFSDWTKIETSINWISLDEAIQVQATTNKPILVFNCVKWCEPCHSVMSNQLQDSTIAEIVNRNFLAVKFKGEGSDTVRIGGRTYINRYHDDNYDQTFPTHPFEMELGLDAYPGWAVIDRSGKLYHSFYSESRISKKEFKDKLISAYVKYRSKQ